MIILSQENVESISEVSPFPNWKFIKSCVKLYIVIKTEHQAEAMIPDCLIIIHIRCFTIWRLFKIQYIARTLGNFLKFNFSQKLNCVCKLGRTHLLLLQQAQQCQIQIVQQLLRVVCYCFLFSVTFKLHYCKLTLIACKVSGIMRNNPSVAKVTIAFLKSTVLKGIDIDIQLAWKIFLVNICEYDYYDYYGCNCDVSYTRLSQLDVHRSNCK